MFAFLADVVVATAIAVAAHAIAVIAVVIKGRHRCCLCYR